MLVMEAMQEMPVPVETVAMEVMQLETDALTQNQTIVNLVETLAVGPVKDRMKEATVVKTQAQRKPVANRLKLANAAAKTKKRKPSKASEKTKSQPRATANPATKPTEKSKSPMPRRQRIPTSPNRSPRRRTLSN
jgi:hypothetical protein